jgi:hypothetical protein
MNLNLIFEEIKVDRLEGTLEVYKTVKRGERIERVIKKHHYKLEKNSSEDVFKNLQMDSMTFKFFKRNFFERIFFKKNKSHLLKMILRESSGFSWILCPGFFFEDLKSSDLFGEKLIFEFNSKNFIFGNFDSVTLLKNEEFLQIIQNSPLKTIKII